MLMLGCKGLIPPPCSFCFGHSLELKGSLILGQFENQWKYEEAIFKVTDETIHCCSVKRNIFDDLQIQDEFYCQESISEVHRATETKMIKKFLCAQQIFPKCLEHLLNKLSNNWPPSPLKSPRY